MARTALRSVSDAIEATRLFVLPLSIHRVASLALVVLFMGTPGTPIPANPQFADPRFWEIYDPTAATNADPDATILADGVELASPGTWPGWLLAVLGIVLLLTVAYVLVGTLMRFVLVEALRTDGVRIRRDGRRHLRNAIGVLVLRIVIWGLTIVTLGLVAVAVVGTGLDVSSLDRTSGAVLGTAATVVLVVAWAIEVLTLQFVVPTMIAADRGVVAGWRRFWPTLRGDPVEYLLYGVVRIGLGVAVGIAAAIAIVVILALAGVVLGTLAAIAIVLAGGFGSLGSVAIAVLGVLLAIFVLVGVAAWAVIAVPFQCYLWIYALLVLGDVDGELDLIPELRAETRSEDGIAV
ncbi:hypothetical protein GCM10028857_22130 [Salinarchaeum chitinilyticum]